MAVVTMEKYIHPVPHIEGENAILIDIERPYKTKTVPIRPVTLENISSEEFSLLKSKSIKILPQAYQGESLNATMYRMHFNENSKSLSLSVGFGPITNPLEARYWQKYEVVCDEIENLSTLLEKIRSEVDSSTIGVPAAPAYRSLWSRPAGKAFF
jgi:hypothetical protein